MNHSSFHTLRSTLLASATGLILAGLSPAACSAGSAADLQGLGASPGSACKGTGCGKACTMDSSCASGLYCDGKICTQECAPGSGTCGASKTCDANGRCQATGSGGASSGGASSGGTSSGGTSSGGASSGGTISVEAGVADPDAQEACLSQDVTYTNDIPNVLLLVDRSGSMHELIMQGGTDVRWTAVREALVNPTTGLVPLAQAQVNFGLTLYTGPDTERSPTVGDMATVGTDDPDYVAEATCPHLVQVPIALSNYTPIEAAFRPITMSQNSKGQTPTGESLEAALPTLTGLDPVAFPGRKVIVLATDGEPDLCANGNDENGGRMRSVMAVQGAYDEGVTTFVISVGSDVGEQHLRQVANVGQGFPVTDTTDRFYRVSDAAQLQQAFSDIVAGVRGCVIALDGSVVGNGANGAISINGMTIPANDPNGWRLNNPSEIEFLGTACDLIKMAANTDQDINIGIKFPCGSYDPK